MKIINKPGKNKIRVWTGITFIVLLFVLCVIIIVSIYNSITRGFFSERSATLNEISEQIAKTIDKTSDSAWNMSEAAFTHMLSHDIGDTSEIPVLLGQAEKGNYKREVHFVLIDSDTHYYLADGTVGVWNNVEFLLDSANERQVIMTTAAFNDNSEHMIFLHRLKEPVILKDGTRITHSALVLSAESYTEAFDVTGFEGSADVFIIHSDGRSIYRRSNTGVFGQSANVLRYIKNMEFMYGGSFEQLEASLDHPSGESLEFVYEDKEYFVSIAPTHTEDWIVTFIMPSDRIQSDSSDLMNTVLHKMVILAVLLVVMFALIIYFLVMNGNNKVLAEQQTKVNEALQRAADEAMRANKAKSEFLSHMSHDLRTPINGIMGMLEIAEENRQDPETVQKCLSKINSVSEHLYSLINDVLDMSSLESGKASFKESQFDLNGLLNVCCSVIQGSSQQRGLNFTYDFNGIQHTHLVGCDLYLRQILINILGNAVKFTNAGDSVTFTVREIAADENTASFSFLIEDTGIGMDYEFQKHIFEPFSQESSGSRTNYEGTGLGMAITKKLIDKMGGTIELYSRVSEGSRFTVNLTFNIDNEAIEVSSECDKTEKTGSVEGMRILLVEDNALNLEIAEYMLARAGAEVVIARNGEEAVRIFENSPVGSTEAVLMDVMMPVMDGFTATKAIRSLDRPDASSVPIIAMTANAFSEDIEKTKEAGMNDHLTKPIDGELLFSILAGYRGEKK